MLLKIASTGYSNATGRFRINDLTLEVVIDHPEENFVLEWIEEHPANLCLRIGDTMYTLKKGKRVI